MTVSGMVKCCSCWLWLECAGRVLLSPVHSLDGVEIVVLQLLPLQLEGVGDQPCLWRPRVGAQVDLHRDLKALEFCCGRRADNVMFLSIFLVSDDDLKDQKCFP